MAKKVRYGRRYNSSQNTNNCTLDFQNYSDQQLPFKNVKICSLELTWEVLWEIQAYVQLELYITPIVRVNIGLRDIFCSQKLQSVGEAVFWPIGHLVHESSVCGHATGQHSFPDSVLCQEELQFEISHSIRPWNKNVYDLLIATLIAQVQEISKSKNKKLRPFYSAHQIFSYGNTIGKSNQLTPNQAPHFPFESTLRAVILIWHPSQNLSHLICILYFHINLSTQFPTISGIYLLDNYHRFSFFHLFI